MTDGFAVILRLKGEAVRVYRATRQATSDHGVKDPRYGLAFACTAVVTAFDATETVLAGGPLGSLSGEIEFDLTSGANAREGDMVRDSCGQVWRLNAPPARQRPPVARFVATAMRVEAPPSEIV